MIIEYLIIQSKMLQIGNDIINSNMIVRERILGEMSNFASESKWEDALNDIMTELFQIRPNNPYLFLQKKMYLNKLERSLKQKMDNSKTSQYLIELTMYITHIDPLITSEQAIKDKVINLCVQKFQHTKIKRTEILQLVNVILLGVDLPRRELFVKILQQMLDREIYSILQYSNILYQTVIYRGVMYELCKMQKRLSDLKIDLNRSIFLQWLNTVNQQSSITKQLGLQIQNNDVFRGIASQICEKIVL